MVGCFGKAFCVCIVVVLWATLLCGMALVLGELANFLCAGILCNDQPRTIWPEARPLVGKQTVGSGVMRIGIAPVPAQLLILTYMFMRKARHEARQSTDFER